MGRAILKAYELGCRFDGWNEMFRFDLWMKAFEESGVDPYYYNRDIGLDEVLPWDFVDIGVSKKFLLKERERSYNEVQTCDCKWGDCRGCGIPGNYADIKLAEIPNQIVEENLVHIGLPVISPTTAQNRQESFPEPGESLSISEDKVGEVELRVDNPP